MAPFLTAVAGAALVVAVVVLLRLRQRRAAEQRARLAQQRRAQRLAADRARHLRERLLALGELDQANERYWDTLRQGGDAGPQRAAIAQVLADGHHELPLTTALFLTQDLTEGEQQGFLAQYGETTLAGGVRFEVHREIDRLSAALWSDLTQSTSTSPPPAAEGV